MVDASAKKEGLCRQIPYPLVISVEPNFAEFEHAMAQL